MLEIATEVVPSTGVTWQTNEAAERVGQELQRTSRTLSMIKRQKLPIWNDINPITWLSRVRTSCQKLSPVPSCSIDQEAGWGGRRIVDKKRFRSNKRRIILKNWVQEITTFLPDEIRQL